MNETVRRPIVIIPTYNEAENVELICRRILEQKTPVDLLFVDDNSPDGTGKIADALAEKDGRIHALHRAGKLGLGTAHVHGLQWAYDRGYRVAITMDCDGTHSPDDIAAFAQHAEEYDVVVGSRFMRDTSLRGWTLHRKFLTRLGHLFTGFFLRIPYDATGAFRLYRLDRIPPGLFSLVHSPGYSFFFESLFVICQNGFRVKEVAIDLPARTYGHSKMRFSDASYSFMLLVHTWLKMLLHEESFTYAPPYIPSDVDAEKFKTEWDGYWSAKSDAKGLVYDLIAAFYRKFIIKRTLNHFLGKHCAPGALLLHAGCGSGQVDTGVATAYRVDALDISAAALSLYAKHNPNHRKLVHASLFEMPPADQAYDCIYNLGVMEHFAEEEIGRILRQFHGQLKADGRLVLFWPPSKGLTVLFLGMVHFILNRLLKKGVKLHPDEISKLRSKRHARELLEKAGFALVEYSFGPRDFFTYAIVVAKKK
ncbi:MAG: glycosyltransferase [Nitrospinae bacterium]|nr:glycosyltransferase [Nitrospinota bacterium]